MRERRQMKAPAVAALLALAIIVGCLLSAEPLYNRAASIDSPALRAVATSAAKPLLTAGEWLHVDRARRWVMTAFAADRAGQASPSAAERATHSTAAAASLPPASAAPTTTTSARSPADAAGRAGTPPTTVAPVTTTTEAKRQVDANRPLRVLVAGDSLVLQVGHAVARLAGRIPLEAKVMSKPMSGLVRPDFYDWPAVLENAEAGFRPDVTVMMFGNNDAQDVTIDGVRMQRSSPEWWDAYRARVERMLGIAGEAGSRVIWVGMPIMRSAKFSETARAYNAVYLTACAAVGASFVDAYRLLSDGDGRYTAYLPDATGRTVLMRGADGIHFSEAGGDRVAVAIGDVLRQWYDVR